MRNKPSPSHLNWRDWRKKVAGIKELWASFITDDKELQLQNFSSIRNLFKKKKMRKPKPKNYSESLALLKRMEGFYYYQNWTAGKKNKIHIHDCGHCNYGAGTLREQKRGVNGVWVGPFKTKELALAKVFELFGKVAPYHSCCE